MNRMVLFCRTIWLALSLSLVLTTATAWSQTTASVAPPSAPTASPVTDASYVLGVGDKLHVTIFGEPDLTGDFDVGDGGYLRLPLIKQIKAAGLTIGQLETQISAQLSKGYLKDPRVSIEVTNYRPFYIIGEVNKPGEYAYVNGMNVLTAVALAGGYTYRADDSDVYIRRKGGTKEQSAPADQTTKIEPGDIIRVGERFF
ncbi:MAG: polysaccharide export protein [Alphaproteobacteria bacterium]|nr:polysaccharide export protein [Alphaproteobacteria bacterium]